MCDEEHVGLKSLDLNNNALKTENHIEVTFATISAISIVKFVESTKLEFFRIPLLNLVRGEAITFSGILSLLAREAAKLRSHQACA